MTYTIQLSGGKSIPLYFGTWSLSRFCELNGNLSFSQMQELFTTNISFNHIMSLLLCGAEHHAKLNKKPFTYTDLDAGSWIDEMGGLAGKETQEVMLLIAKTIFPDAQGIEKVKGSKKK